MTTYRARRVISVPSGGGRPSDRAVETAACIFLVVAVLLIASGPARAQGVIEIFDTEPFADRWSLTSPDCTVWNSGPETVDVGLPDDINCDDTSAIIKSPKTTTFPLSQNNDFYFYFNASFHEQSGATGGAVFVFFGFVTAGANFDGTGPIVSAIASVYLSANCVSVTAYMQYDDASTDFGAESTCTIDLDLESFGSIVYTASTDTLDVSLAGLTSTITTSPNHAFHVTKAGVQTESAFIVGTTVSDVSYDTGGGGGGGGGGGPIPGLGWFWFVLFILALAVMVAAAYRFREWREG